MLGAQVWQTPGPVPKTPLDVQIIDASGVERVARSPFPPLFPNAQFISHMRPVVGSGRDPASNVDCEEKGT